MNGSVGWFVALAAATALAWCAGQSVGRQGGRSAAWLVVAGVLLGLWAYLIHHPAVAVRLISVPILTHIEGVAAVPVFMFILGIMWSRSAVARQRRVVAWAAMLGVVYFLQGGLWMLQTTPTMGFAAEVQRGAVMQSQAFSCVPAACATALNRLGVYTSEAEMAHLTQTWPGTGTTTVRALAGLNQRLADTRYRAVLVDVPASNLRALPMPALTPLQFEPTRRHMVTLLHADQWGVWFSDPAEGYLFLEWDRFKPLYREQVLVFVTTNQPLDS